MASRNPLPTNIKALRGTLRKDRTNPHEPKPRGEIGDPPDHLSEAARACWSELVEHMPPGVAFDSDRLSLELAACLLAEFRADPAGFMAAKLTRLHSLLASFGMTPSDRSRVAVADPIDPDDPWLKLK